MALSISPTVAWDFTLGNPAGLTSVAGASSILTLNGGTLNSSGHLSTANGHTLLVDPATTAARTNPNTVVVCVSVAANAPAGAVLAGIRNVTADNWAFALQVLNDGVNDVYVVNANGSAGGRYSSQIRSAVTEAVIVAHVASGAAKIWYNGTQVLSGSGAAVTYGASNYLIFNNIGTNSGTTLKYAAFYSAEPSAADITALGSNATSAYSAIFGAAASARFRPYFITG